MVSETVVFGPGFWGPILATAALLLIAAVGGFILLAAKKVSKLNPQPHKLETYTCGEVLRAEEFHADNEQFFSPIRRVFRPFYRYIRPAHGGDLGSYLFWVEVGSIAILLSIVLALGGS